MTRRAIRLLALVPLLALLSTCGGDGGGSTGPASVASVTVSPSSATLTVGDEQQLAATVKDSDGNTLTDRTVTWSSSAGSVASVTSSGLVEALSAGSATISATSEGRSGTAAITVEAIPVASVEVDAGDGEVFVGETLQLTVTLKDADGNELTGRTVDWSSSNDGFATVNSSGLVTGVAVGEVTITAESEGEEGTADVTVRNPSFEPTADTDIEGTHTYETFNIPAGVTVTVTGDLEVTATDELTVDGTLMGDCYNVTLRSDVDASIGGTVSNTCTTDPDTETPGDLVIAATTDITLDQANLSTTGDGLVTNDESLTDEDFDAEALAATAARARAASQIGQCLAIGASFDTDPVQAKSGSESDETGGSGRDAHTWRLNCNGDATLNGGTEVNGQAGGDGGDAENDDSDTSDGSAEGGDGGDGGKLKVQSTGSIWFNNSNGGGTTLNLAPGGHGGDAAITATAPGGSATATGGDGGDSGSFRVAAGGGITIDEGGLTIDVGDGGDGGDATAIAADGLDAGEAAAQDGGSASATGGKGGTTPKGELRATGNVTGLANVQLTGGNGGWGGEAIASAGAGGDGNQEFPPGADGGDIHAEGGDGGDSRVEVSESVARPTALELGPLLVPVGDGGPGGPADFSGGWAGFGWDGCSVDPEEQGGPGGEGGVATGEDGEGGEGATDGTDGGVTILPGTGDGGDGGDGDGPGAGGDAGSQAGVTNHGVLDDQEPNFVPGEMGEECGATMVSVVPRFNTFAESGGTLDIDTYIANLQEAGGEAILGTLPFEALGDEGFSFLGLDDPERLGAWFDNFWRIDMLGIDLTGLVDAFIEDMEICVLNTFGGDVVVNFRDAGLNLLGSTMIQPTSAPIRGPAAGSDAFGACVIINDPPVGTAFTDIVPGGMGSGGLDFFIMSMNAGGFPPPPPTSRR